MTGVIVGAIVEQLDWPGTREEKGARGVKGTVVGDKGGNGESEGAVVSWGWKGVVVECSSGLDGVSRNT